MPFSQAPTNRTALFASLALGLALAPAFAAPAPIPFTHREEGALIFENVPPRDPALSERMSPYLQSRHANFLDWASDGTALISTRFGDTDQLHRVLGPMGAREREGRQCEYF